MMQLNFTANQIKRINALFIRLCFHSINDDWKESEHKRDKNDKFTTGKSSQSAMKSVKANIQRGRNAMNTAIAEKRTVHRAMYQPDLGWVDFEWGDEGRIEPNGKSRGAMGISHIIDKRMKVDGMSYSEVTKFLTLEIVHTIATGKIEREKSVGIIKAVMISKNDTLVRLTKKSGNNAWVVTGYKKYQPMNE